MNRQGFALESSLFLMLLIAVLVAVSVSGIVPVVRTADADYRNARVTYAAEAGADAIMAQLELALDNDGVLSDAEMNAMVPPTIAGFSYDAVSVQRIGGTVPETVTDGPFAGLMSWTTQLEINSRVRDYQNNSSEVIVSAKAQAIPIFQFGVFFEKDLEITNGPNMWFDGWIHSNGNVYLSSNNAWYRNMVTTPNSVIHNRKDRDRVYNGVYIADAFATDVPLDFDSRSHPNPVDFRYQSNLKFDDRLKTGAYGVDSLRLPLPAGMLPITVMQPRLVADDPMTRSAKFSWKADWYIEIDLGNLPSMCGSIGVRDGGQTIPSAADCNNIFTFTSDAWYDKREDVFVDQLEIDMNMLFNWSAIDSVARTTNILYLTFTNVGMAPDPQGDGVNPVVRLIQGQDLGNPITIATDRPMYILGDFNVDDADWKPAAVVADAMIWLSNAWVDADHQTTGGPLQNASNTEYNAAVLAGHSETPWDWFDAGNAPYGGGLENFPRFLERWSGRTTTYKGSLVSLITSVYAVGPWDQPNVYNPPSRVWSFDTRFEDLNNLPPGTPVVGNVVHTAFRPVY